MASDSGYKVLRVKIFIRAFGAKLDFPGVRWDMGLGACYSWRRFFCAGKGHICSRGEQGGSLAGSVVNGSGDKVSCKWWVGSVEVATVIVSQRKPRLCVMIWS